jgi:chaperonin GroES
MIDNTSGITPVGHRILIKPLATEQTTESGIVISVGEAADRERLAQIKGTVIEVGLTAYSDQPVAWCKVGDVVTFGKYSGLIYKNKDTLDGEEYRVVNDLDIVCIHKEG